MECPHFTCICCSLYHIWSICTIYLGTPRFNNLSKKIECDTRSKAFDMSRKQAYTGVLRRVYSSVTFLRTDIAMSVPWFDLYANWLLLVLRKSQQRFSKMISRILENVVLSAIVSSCSYYLLCISASMSTRFFAIASEPGNWLPCYCSTQHFRRSAN